jgi:hypothetical protein
MATKYLLSRTVRGTVRGPEHRILIEIPEGTVVSLIGPVEDDPRFVEILWDGQSAQIFASDFDAIATHCEMNSFRASAGASDGAVHQGQSAQSSEVKVRRFSSSGREL